MFGSKDINRLVTSTLLQVSFVEQQAALYITHITVGINTPRSITHCYGMNDTYFFKIHQSLGIQSQGVRHLVRFSNYKLT